MPESYKPGSRRKAFGQNHQFAENRYAWVTVDIGKFLILVGNDSGSGSDVVLFHPRPGRMTDVSLSLSNLTMEELDAMEELFKTAFDWARPVVERRDKEAQDAWESGDDSYSRNYRAVPQLVFRKRPEWEHGESLHERPAGVPEGGGGGGGDSQGGVRGAGDELAEPHEDDLESEDDQSPSD